MPTMIRPKRTFATNNATATPQNDRSLAGSSPRRRVRKSPATVVVGLLRLERTTGLEPRDPNLGNVVLYH